jgi:2-phosphoglycerate kinase
MVIGGHEKPWLSQYHTDLIWLNIRSITRNYIAHDHDVVIDYVAFMPNAERIAKELQGQAVTVKFVVLVTSEEELLRRDSERLPHARMGQRCIEGLKELRQSNLPENFILNTTHMEVEAVVREIRSHSKYVVPMNGGGA